jgi:hypothetical protein
MTEQPNKSHHTVRILPTVGRVVLFHLGHSAVGIGPYLGWGITPDGSNTYSARVAYVHSEHMVNLAVDDCNGIAMGFQSVPLVQGDDERPVGHWCEWMPYQKGQAAKAEQLEAALATADRVHRAHESGEARFGEPPVLNTPARQAFQKAVAEGTTLSDPRHPAIAAAQPLDNDGNPILRTGLDDGPDLPRD